MLRVVISALLMTGASQAATLTVITHDSFDLDKKLVASFEARTGSRVRFIKGGDAGELLNKLILTKAAPIADVVYGLDNTLLPKARAAGILEPYRSPALAKVPAADRLDEGGLLNTVDVGYVAFNIDKAYFDKQKLAPPKSLDDLSNPQYAKLTVVQSPATSSPGLAFLLASVHHYGEAGAWSWWKTARANGMKVTRGWEDAYNKEFSKNGGRYPIVLSYATSPAAEVAYSEKPLTASPTANLFLPGSSFKQLEGVGILKGSKQRTLARQFVDFMLSAPVQADFPTRMWVYPAVTGTKLAPVFEYAQKPEDASVAAAVLNRAPQLTDAWVNQVLRAR